MDGNAQQPRIGEDGFLKHQNKALDVNDDDLNFFKRNATHEDHKRAIQYVKKGVKYYNIKDYRRAIECFRKALRRDDAYSRAYYYLGNACYKIDRLTDAMCNWQLTIDADPDSDSAVKAREKMKKIFKQRSNVKIVD